MRILERRGHTKHTGGGEIDNPSVIRLAWDRRMTPPLAQGSLFLRAFLRTTDGRPCGNEALVPIKIVYGIIYKKTALVN